MSPDHTPPAHSSEPRRASVFPGFKEMGERRRVLVHLLVEHRLELGLTQTEVAARMGTSQSSVARLEAGDSDARVSTLERYAAALDASLEWRLEEHGRR
ncbi:MAG: helix-turn-helix domain-containing protein [Acidimicrobiales bacterium]